MRMLLTCPIENVGFNQAANMGGERGQVEFLGIRLIPKRPWLDF